MWASLDVRHKLGSLYRTDSISSPLPAAAKAPLGELFPLSPYRLSHGSCIKISWNAKQRNKTLILTFINTPTPFGDVFIPALHTLKLLLCPALPASLSFPHQPLRSSLSPSQTGSCETVSIICVLNLAPVRALLTLHLADLSSQTKSVPPSATRDISCLLSSPSFQTASLISIGLTVGES